VFDDRITPVLLASLECEQAPSLKEDGIVTLHPRSATVGILATLVVMRPERRSTASHQAPPSAQKEEL
jgi:hypothetical protein